MAKQLLGNKDLRTTLIYVQRDVSALTDVAQLHWKRTNDRSSVDNENVVQGPWGFSKKSKPGRKVGLG